MGLDQNQGAFCSAKMACSYCMDSGQSHPDLPDALLCWRKQVCRSNGILHLLRWKTGMLAGWADRRLQICQWSSQDPSSAWSSEPSQSQVSQPTLELWQRLMLLYYVTLSNLMKAQNQTSNPLSNHSMFWYYFFIMVYFINVIEHFTKKNFKSKYFC